MIKRVDIHSYKLLYNLSLESFGCFNIFTGRNNAGKTSVLEAIYLNTWDESPMDNLIKIFDKFRDFRLNKDSAELLFYKRNLESNIGVTAQFDNKDIYKIALEIGVGKSDSVDEDSIQLDFSFNFERNDSEDTKKTKLIIEENKSVHNYGRIVEVSRRIAPKEAKMLMPYYNALYSTFIPANVLSIDVLDYFIEKVLKPKKKKEFLKWLKVFDEQIADVFQMDKDVCVQLKNEANEEGYPIQSYGIGFIKYFVICCSLVQNSANYIFIDEIENGLHYKSVERLLDMILKLSQEYGIQVFATTHNAEFLHKMLKSAEKQKIEDIMLFNLYKYKGQVKASSYDYFSIKQELEEYGSELRF
ncbi:AAA family ATPase [Helicobacter cetorum]|uniref:AAA family ATPase n=1 Tax=Helicobacter cetorum TaxID=138563 RepID=UPI00131596D5|nr:AAA family ATPase [Helicobacter cetorum]